ncbi:hypothetical protein [Kineococcus aurantiacus]|uniref:Uncharacterized protein n=1 Tax=Kineococcus aurantiacus TaxID=37633 RepID=A0A7Y9DJV5_9ACTN|nr:hypothetical protein [Kineococcus aurantiacus]NYD21808.1 hypothetical protein [Kineococcus aurantiacus]
MATWRSFIDLVHLIGALGCLVLTGGFAAQGQLARAVFYGLCTMAFAVALAHRVHERHQHARPSPTVVDLRERTRAGEVPRPPRGAAR